MHKMLKFNQKTLSVLRQMQPILDAYQTRLSIQNSNALIQLWHDLPPNIRELITIDQDDIEIQTVDEPIEIAESSDYQDLVQKVKSGLETIQQLDPELFKNLIYGVNLENANNIGDAEIRFQKRKPGAPRKTLYNELHFKINQGIMTHDEAFDYYCIQKKIQYPTQRHRKRFKRAMKYRDDHPQNTT